MKFFNQPFDDERFDLVNDITFEHPAGLISLATDFEDVDTDLYKSRGRKTHIASGQINVVDDSDIFTMSPLS